MEPLVLVGFLVVVGAAIVVSFTGGRAAWEDFAARNGLEVRGWYFRPVIEGRYRGASIRVKLRKRALRKNVRITRYHVAVGEPMPAGFSVCRRGLLDRLGSALGIRDITVGKPAFDDTLSIRGEDTERIVRLLGIPEVGTAVHGMAIVNPTLRIGQSLVLEEVGFADGERLRWMLDALCDLAGVLQEGSRRLAAEDGGAGGMG